MDEIAATVVTALASGATAVAKKIATDAVLAAYGGLKRIVLERYRSAEPFITAVEADPSSPAEQQVLSKQLLAVHEHPEIKLSALALLEALETLRDVPAAQGLLDFGTLRAARAFELKDIELTGPLLRAEDATFLGDFKAEGIRQSPSGKG